MLAYELMALQVLMDLVHDVLLVAEIKVQQVDGDSTHRVQAAPDEVPQVEESEGALGHIGSPSEFDSRSGQGIRRGREWCRKNLSS